jgi:hypothetical protein
MLRITLILDALLKEVENAMLAKVLQMGRTNVEMAIVQHANKEIRTRDKINTPFSTTHCYPRVELVPEN